MRNVNTRSLHSLRISSDTGALTPEPLARDLFAESATVAALPLPSCSAFEVFVNRDIGKALLRSVVQSFRSFLLLTCAKPYGLYPKP